MPLSNLKDPDFQKKLREVETPEELLAIAQEEGYELSDAELDGISGGVNWDCWDICDAKGPTQFGCPNRWGDSFLPI